MEQKSYDLSAPVRWAQDEWREFERADDFVRALRDVRFQPTDANHSRLCVPLPADAQTPAIDAVVQRFRDRLARKGLSGEAAAGSPG